MTDDFTLYEQLQKNEVFKFIRNWLIPTIGLKIRVISDFIILPKVSSGEYRWVHARHKIREKEKK